MAATATKSKPKSQSKVTLQPLGDKVVVEREESQEKTAGGIYIPDAAKDKPTRGTIISVGTGKVLDDGTRGKGLQRDFGLRFRLGLGSGGGHVESSWYF